VRAHILRFGMKLVRAFVVDLAQAHNRWQAHIEAPHRSPLVVPLLGTHLHEK
jgi:hypothetical protein